MCSSIFIQHPAMVLMPISGPSASCRKRIYDLKSFQYRFSLVLRLQLFTLAKSVALERDTIHFTEKWSKTHTRESMLTDTQDYIWSVIQGLLLKYNNVFLKQLPTLFYQDVQDEESTFPLDVQNVDKVASFWLIQCEIISVNHAYNCHWLGYPIVYQRILSIL